MWENLRRRSTVYLCQINFCYDHEFLFLVAVYGDGSERNPIYSLLYKHKLVLRRLQLSSKYMTLTGIDISWRVWLQDEYITWNKQVRETHDLDWLQRLSLTERRVSSVLEGKTEIPSTKMIGNVYQTSIKCSISKENYLFLCGCSK